MNVEYKTENGRLLFILQPEEASDLTYPKVGMIDLYFQTKSQSKYEEDNYISIGLPDTGFQIIGFTSEVKEEHLTKIFKQKMGILYEMFGYDYLTSDVNNAFKSLIQNLHINNGKWIVLFKPE